MNTEARQTSPTPVNDAAFARIRTIIVPADIVPVRRQSPIPLKKRTPWRPQPEGQPTERAGTREWFGDHVFIETPPRPARSCYGTSAAVHVSGVMVLLFGLITRSVPIPEIRDGPSLIMPILMTAAPVAASSASSPPRGNLSSAPSKQSPPREVKPQEMIAPTQLVSATPTPAAPIEAPSGIEPEPGAEHADGGNVAGTPNGAGAGGGGGIDGGLGTGRVIGASPAGTALRGPVRLGRDMQGLRRIKEVKPVYPIGALSEQTRGTVIIEATIGTDGKVVDAKVVRSIPMLDQAAVDSVLQWEYEPMLLNGVPVAVIVTILVHFAIY